MDFIEDIFKYKAVNLNNLTAYGFSKNDDIYTYTATLDGSGFTMTVSVTANGDVTAEVIDSVIGEPYTLHLSDDAVGSFVGAVREEYEKILTDIAEKCFNTDVFKTEQARELIAFVSDAYGDKLEFLWEKFPDNAIWRRSDNKKWYAVILTVSKRKLGLGSDEKAEVLDLRLEPDQLEKLVDGTTYFPGYHMNKKHWYTIILDGSVPFDEICDRIKISYTLAKK